MQGIFVSYRRQDSQSAAGRLSDHLRDHLSGVPIFRDVETIAPGIDFVEAIDRALQSCAVLIAVIGPRWTHITDAAGKRRLEDPGDYTRLEIATALKRRDVRVIPVLVEGAAMPAGADLPEDLAALARRHAIELSDKRWDYDVSQLVKTLRDVLGLGEPGPAQVPDPPRPTRRKSLKVVAGAAFGVAVLGALNWESALDLDGMAVTAPPAMPAPPAQVQTLAPAPPVVPAHDLSGAWSDTGGGQYRVVQQGSQLAIQGLRPEGAVLGGGELHGNGGWINYTLNGHPLSAQITVSADGTQLDALVTDPSTGQRTPVRMWRTR